jgi:hypothetical protein
MLSTCSADLRHRGPRPLKKACASAGSRGKIEANVMRSVCCAITSTAYYDDSYQPVNSTLVGSHLPLERLYSVSPSQVDALQRADAFGIGTDATWSSPLSRVDADAAR